jgi:Spy/CpxP family protein refolding chaperone
MLSKMWKTWSGKMVLSVAAVTLIMAAVAIAADAPAGGPAGGPGMAPPPGAPEGMGPGGPGGQGGQRGNRPQMNPEEMQKRRLEQIKTALQLADDKWTAVEPLLKKTMTLSAELRGGMFGMNRRGPNAEQTPPAAPANEIAAKTTELRTLVADPAATEDAIKAKLAELAAAKDKVKAALATAKTDLCKVLTAKQQASLVLMGILD